MDQKKEPKLSHGHNLILAAIAKLQELLTECCENFKTFIQNQATHNEEAKNSLKDIKTTQELHNRKLDAIDENLNKLSQQRPTSDVTTKTSYTESHRSGTWSWAGWLFGLAVFGFVIWFLCTCFPGCNPKKDCDQYTTATLPDVHALLATSIVDQKHVNVFMFENCVPRTDTSVVAIHNTPEGLKMWELINTLYEHTDKQVELIIDPKPDSCGNIFVKGFREYLPEKTKTDTIKNPTPPVHPIDLPTTGGRSKDKTPSDSTPPSTEEKKKEESNQSQATRGKDSPRDISGTPEAIQIMQDKEVLKEVLVTQKSDGTILRHNTADQVVISQKFQNGDHVKILTMNAADSLAQGK